MNTAAGDEKSKLKELQRSHQQQADMGYESKRCDKAKAKAKASWTGKRRIQGEKDPCSRDAVDIITFDFEQNLPTPNLHHNDMFYARQLWVYNFGIHDCVSDQGHMLMWGEHVAKRGSSEVVSCLQTFLQEYRTGAR